MLDGGRLPAQPQYGVSHALSPLDPGGVMCRVEKVLEAVLGSLTLPHEPYSFADLDHCPFSVINLRLEFNTSEQVAESGVVLGSQM